METNARSLQFSDIFGQRRHICAFFNSADEEHRVLRTFITDGFDRRGKAIHLVDPERRDEHLSWLTAAGINAQEAMSNGQLEVWPWEDGPLRGGRFDQEVWLASLEQALKSGSVEGYAETDFFAHMEWALADRPGLDDFIEFESRLNYVVPKYENTAICAYDLSKFGASVVMDALRTHPVVIIGGLLQENPFFVPPDQLLAELRERRAAAGRASATR